MSMGVPDVPSRAPTVFTFVDENCRPLSHFQMSLSLSTRQRQDFIGAEREMMMMGKTTTFWLEKGIGNFRSFWSFISLEAKKGELCILKRRVGKERSDIWLYLISWMIEDTMHCHYAKAMQISML